MFRAAICVGVLLLNIHASRAAELMVFADTPLQYALIKIGAAFEQETGHKITFAFGSSPDIQRRINSGEAADVVIVQPNFLVPMIKDGILVGGDRSIFTRIGFGLGVRAQMPSPEISNSQEFKQALLNADSLVFNNVASGEHFAKVLERLGIAEAVKNKVTRLGPDQVFAKVLEGKGNDIAVGTITQIKGTPGIKYVGPLPGVFQNSIPYTAAPSTTTKFADVANAFVKYVSSPKAKSEYIASGGE
jgi:molybdate transport system substrate-binding protein